jgi:hypothetical protein
MTAVKRNISIIMIFRKIAATFLIIMFIVLAMPNFLLYGLSRTYLNTEFYRKDDLVQGVYNFALDKTVAVLQENSELFKGYFSSADLRMQLEKVFTKKILGETLSEFADQIDVYKKDTSKPLTISLRTLRANLLTVGNNLAYLVYQKLPTCSESDLLKISTKEIPECIPKSLPYEDVMRPVTDNFEATIYNDVPDELSNFDQALPLKEMVNVDSYRNISFLVLIVILALVAIVIYGKITILLAYIASGFLAGGVVGYGFSFALTSSIANFQGQMGDPRSQEFLVFVLSFLIGEVQRMSIMFMVVGLALFLIRFVLRRTVDSNINAVQNFNRND